MDGQGYQIQVGGDFREIFAEFARLDRQAQTSGQNIGKGINDGLATANANIEALSAQLKTLTQTRSKLAVDSSEYRQVQQTIDQLLFKLGQAKGEKLRLQADVSAIDAAAASLGRIGPAARQAGAEAGKGLSEATDNFRLLDGVVQGVAFSLSNAVVSGAGQAFDALKRLVDGYAELDTTIRQAAGADGSAGAYDKLSAAIDKVGIDAAGTQQQVAELSLELIRGGLTADQVSQSLAGIVRGAEATATPYSRMGEIVSATLTSFGLQATETTRVVDALVQGANSSATDVSGLGQAFKTSAPAAKLLGISVEGLTTAVGLFTNAGITAGEAGTTLRNGLSQLGSAAPQTGAGMTKLTGQAKEASDVMKALKLDIYNSTGTLKPMETVLLQLKGAFDKLGPAAQIQLASKLFGGTDDGTKWLAVLGQSEEKIRTMAKAMDGAKGATDRNRDAMQGYKLAMQQLTGTIDSLGNNVGRIAVTALFPLVNAANAAVGAVAGLPGPLKDAVIAMGLLAGAVTGAATAMVVFQRVSQMGVAQKAAAEVAALASGIRENLGGAISRTRAIIPGLITQMQVLGALKLDGADGAVKKLGDALKNGLKSSLEAAKASLVSFKEYLDSANFATFVANVKAATAALLPFALALAGVSAAIYTYKQITADSSDIAQSAEAGQLKLAEAMAKAGIETGKLTTLGGPFARAWETGTSALEPVVELLRKIPGVGDLAAGAFKKLADNATAAFPAIALLAKAFELWKGSVDDATTVQSIELANAALQNLQQQTTNVQNAAAGLIAKFKGISTPLTPEQVKEIKATGDALKAARDRAAQLKDDYLRLAAAARNSGNKELVKEYEAKAAAADADIQLTGVQITQLNNLGKASQQQVGLTEEQIKANIERAQTELEINKILSTRKVDNQLATGQALLNLAKAAADVEQSRFSVTRAALEYELGKAQERKASDQQIKAIKDQIAANDKAALSARYRALTQQQDLESAMLRITQEKQRIEADLSVQEAKIGLLKAEGELAKAKTEEEKQAAIGQINLQREIIGLQEGKRNILGQTQQIELAITGLQQEGARNGEQAKGAALGYKIAADGTLEPLNRLATAWDRVGSLTGASADEQRILTGIAEQTGMSIGRAADGTLVLGRNQQDVADAIQDANNKQLEVTRSIEQSTQKTGQLAGGFKDAEGKAKGIEGTLSSAKDPAGALVTAFQSIDNKAPAVTQAARDFASYLASAKTFAERIDGLNLSTAIGAVATNMQRASGAAQSFYDWLQKASRLPGSRWTGGPVEAGAEYRVNELGQEALLSAGRLSLIDAAPNSIWRAPSDGVVIPAGITSRIAAAAVSPGGSSAAPGVADLAIEIGKLRAEVGNLARRDWSVHVQHRTGPTGAQVMRTLLS